MATLSSLVSLFRNKYKTISDDTKITDRTIIRAFDICRAKLAYDWSQKQKKLSDQWYVSFCMELCLGTPIKCPCIAEAQCSALVSKYKLPKSAGLGGNQHSIYIRTADGRQLSKMSPQQASVMNYNPAYKDKPSYWIENYRGDRYLVIWNTLDLKYVYVTMVPDSLDEIAEVPGCDSADTTDPVDCSDWRTEEYPIEANLEFNLFKMAENLLMTNMRMSDDLINDAVDKVTPNPPSYRIQK